MLAATMLAVLAPQTGPESVYPANAHLATPVGGLERTDAAAEVVPVSGQPFRQALKVIVRKTAAESNATQLTIMNPKAIAKGDVLQATFWVRGTGSQGNPAGVTFMFEKATSPWTKSVTLGANGNANPSQWRKATVAFASAENYAPGEAMASFRFATQTQTVLLGGFSLLNYRKTRTLDQVQQLATEQSPLGSVRVDFDFKNLKQTMLGFGGNFCQPRYGSSEAMDKVGETVLKRLNVVHARIGLPLNHWTPAKGEYRDSGPAKASFEALRLMKRRGIPTMVSVWEGPQWLVGGAVEGSGKVLPESRYADCIQAITAYLVKARDSYGVEPVYFSFNEPDYGVNFKFNPTQMRNFIRQAVPAWRKAGLKTKFVVADTANGSSLYDFAKPILEDPTIRDMIGPIAYHSWDALNAPDSAYRRIADLARKHKKPVWCLEAGHDAQLWQANDPWESWENALRTAMVYERSIRLSEAQLMSYWTYQDNYPLASKDGTRPFAVLHVMAQMEQVFVPGSRVAWARRGSGDLQALATVNGSRMAALLVNPRGRGEAVVSGFNPAAKVRVETSVDGSVRKVTQATVSRAGTLKISIPTRSVVTLVQLLR